MGTVLTCAFAVSLGCRESSPFRSPAELRSPWALVLTGEDVHIGGLASHPDGLVALGSGRHPVVRGASLVDDGEAFVSSFDSEGQLRWGQGLVAPGHTTTDGPIVLGDGSIVFVGSFSGSLRLDEVSVVGAGPRDCFIARISASGEPLGLVAFGGTGETVCRGVSAPEGRLVVVGFFSETLRLGRREFVSEGMFDVMAFEVELASLEASRAMAFGSQGEDIARGVLALDEQRLVVVGSYGSPWGSTPEPALEPTFRALRFVGGSVLEAVGDADGFVAEVDWEGRSRWQVRFAEEGFDVVKSIARYDGGYVLGATNQRGAPPPGISGLASDVPLSGFVASLGVDGEERWRWTDPHLASPHAVVPTRDGHVLVAGHHRPGLEVAGVRWDTAGDLDAMLVRLGPGGVPVGGWHCGGPGLDLAYAAAVGPNGAAYVGGQAEEPGSTCTGPSGGTGGFLARVARD